MGEGFLPQAQAMTQPVSQTGSAKGRMRTHRHSTYSCCLRYCSCRFGVVVHRTLVFHGVTGPLSVHSCGTLFFKGSNTRAALWSGWMLNGYLVISQLVLY